MKNKDNCWLVLPDVVAVETFTYKYKNLKSIITENYPEIAGEMDKFNKKNIYDFLINQKICLVRYLIKRTGIHNILVFGEKARQTIIKDLENTDININLKVIKRLYQRINFSEKYLPLEDRTEEFLLGTFGIPENCFKRVDLIIQAVNKLVEKGISIKLVMAGLNVDNYLKSIENTDNIISIDSPPSEDWFKIMNSVDIAIQLRENAFAFTSGCVSELLGLGKNSIFTKNMIDESWCDLCYFVPEHLEAEELASELENALSREYKVCEELYVENARLNVVNQVKTLILM
jgi:glycosyltransferase involved in cell wall biosynthesis